MFPYLKFSFSAVLAFLFILLTMISVQYYPVSATNEYILSACDTDGQSYTNTSSSYKTNLKQVLSDMVTSSASNTTSFYNTSHGSGEDQVYGIFYCRFDIKLGSVCHDCIKAAAEKILQDCNSETTTAAVIWYDTCTLRFANHSMYNLVEDISAHSTIRQKVRNPNEFVRAIRHEMLQLIGTAAYNASSQGHAYGVKEVTETQKAYCFVQCRPDTTGEDCYSCLITRLTLLQICCGGGNIWALDVGVNCQMRYDVSPFLEVPMEPAAAMSSLNALLPSHRAPSSDFLAKGLDV